MIWLTISPDGQALAAVGETSPAGSELQVWDLKTGRSRFTIHEQSRSNRPQAAFSSDSRRIACALSSFQVGVWDAADGKELALYQGHLGTVTAVAFSHDGRNLLSADEYGTLKVWDAPAGASALTLNPEDPTYESAVSPDARRIATVTRKSSSGTSTGVTVWDSTGRLLVSLKRSTARENEAFHSRSLDWSARGDRLAYATANLFHASRGGLTVWDPDGKELFNLDEEGIGFWGVALSPDGTRVAAAVGVGTKIDSLRMETRVWDIASGRQLWSVSTPSTEPRSTALAFDSGGKRLTAGLSSRIRVWDALTGAERANCKGPSSGADSIAFSPDGLRIAATIGDRYTTGELIVCDVASGKIRKLGQAFTGVTFSPDGTRIAAWIGSIAQTAEVGLWDAVTGRQLLVLKGHAGRTLSRGIAFLPGGDRMLSVAQLSSPTRPLEVKIWDATPWPGVPGR